MIGTLLSSAQLSSAHIYILLCWAFSYDACRVWSRFLVCRFWFSLYVRSLRSVLMLPPRCPLAHRHHADWILLFLAPFLYSTYRTQINDVAAAGTERVRALAGDGVAHVRASAGQFVPFMRNAASAAADKVGERPMPWLCCVVLCALCSVLCVLLCSPELRWRVSLLLHLALTA
jgi:hypothetical protein